MLEYLFSAYIHYKYVTCSYTMFVDSYHFAKIAKDQPESVMPVKVLIGIVIFVWMLLHTLVSGYLFMWAFDHAGILPQITLQQGFILDGLITMFIPASMITFQKK
jgi:hypothetical protein